MAKKCSVRYPPAVTKLFVICWPEGHITNTLLNVAGLYRCIFDTIGHGHTFIDWTWTYILC